MLDFILLLVFIVDNIIQMVQGIVVSADSTSHSALERRVENLLSKFDNVVYQNS